jgi:hypothetical protein
MAAPGKEAGWSVTRRAALRHDTAAVAYLQLLVAWPGPLMPGYSSRSRSRRCRRRRPAWAPARSASPGSSEAARSLAPAWHASSAACCGTDTVDQAQTAWVVRRRMVIPPAFRPGSTALLHRGLGTLARRSQSGGRRLERWCCLPIEAACAQNACVVTLSVLEPFSGNVANFGCFAVLAHLKWMIEALLLFSRPRTGAGIYLRGVADGALRSLAA